MNYTSCVREIIIKPIVLPKLLDGTKKHQLVIGGWSNQHIKTGDSILFVSIDNQIIGSKTISRIEIGDSYYGMKNSFRFLPDHFVFTPKVKFTQELFPIFYKNEGYDSYEEFKRYAGRDTIKNFYCLFWDNVKEY